MPALGIPRNRSLIATSSLRKLPWLLKPLHDLVVAHVLAAERLHTDDAPVPVLTKDKTVTARSWVYVRDDQPFAGLDPPATLFRYSRDRSGDHPVEHLRTVAGILQADAYADYNRLYDHGRSPRPVTEALCWAHDRRRFYELAEIAAGKRRGERAPPISPLALEAVKRIDALFDIEREINGESAERRLAVRRALAPRRRGQGDEFHVEAQGRLRPFPRRRPHLPHEQRRGAGAQAAVSRTQIMAVCRLRSWRRARRCDVVHSDRHRQAQRRRPPGLAGRRPWPHRRLSAEPPARAPALALEG